MVDITSRSLWRVGGKFYTIIVELFTFGASLSWCLVHLLFIMALVSFSFIFCSSFGVLFICFLLWLLTSLVLLESFCKFLQVHASIHLGGFYLWLLTLLVLLESSCKFLQVPPSTCSPMDFTFGFQHQSCLKTLQQLPSMLFESFCKILHQPSMLLPLLVCQFFTSFFLIKCKCFQPLC